MSIDGGVPSEQAIGAHNAGFDALLRGVAKTIIGKIRTAIRHEFGSATWRDGWLVEGSFTRRAKFSCAYGTPHSPRQAGDLQI